MAVSAGDVVLLFGILGVAAVLLVPPRRRVALA
jgi:hypothetical protein